MLPPWCCTIQPNGTCPLSLSHTSCVLLLLTENGIGDAGITALGPALAVCPQLQCLDLRGTAPSLPPPTVDLAPFTYSHPHSASGFATLSTHAVSQLLACLQSCPHLTKLGLGKGAFWAGTHPTTQQPPPLQTSHPSKRCCTQSPTGAFKSLQPPRQDSPSLQHCGCVSMVGCTHPAIHQRGKPLTPSNGLTEPMDEDSATALGNAFKLTCKELRDVRLWAGSTAKPHSLSHSPTSPP